MKKALLSKQNQNPNGDEMMLNQFVNTAVKKHQNAIIGIKELMMMWHSVVLDEEQEKVLDGKICYGQDEVIKSFALMLRIIEHDLQGYIDCWGGDNEGDEK